ncbi:unnamed protein product [Amoebophrya sp. A25]|nr:unnamed protein product [Amoebophrya sp. A25]|eukprot:GSA25T00009054001.1
MPSPFKNPALVKDETNPNSTSMKDAFRPGQKNPTHDLEEFMEKHGGPNAFDNYESVTVRNQTSYDHYFNDPEWKALLKMQNAPLEEEQKEEASDSPPKVDTFERCLGHRVYDLEEPWSKETGRFWREGNKDLNAAKDYRSKGPRQMLHEVAAAGHAGTYLEEVEEIESKRCVFERPEPTMKEAMLRTGLPVSDGSPSKGRKSADKKATQPVTNLRTQTAYTKDAPITFYSEQLKSDAPFVRSTVYTSAITGHQVFGKNSKFSAPTQLSVTSIPHKTEADNTMFHESEDRRRAGDPRPSASSASSSTLSGNLSLPHLKITLVAGLRERGGPLCLAKLRKGLASVADAGGFVQTSDAAQMLTVSGVDQKCIGYLLERMEIDTAVAIDRVMQALRPPIREKGDRDLFIKDILSSSEGWEAVCSKYADKFGVKSKDQARIFLTDLGAVCADAAEMQAVLADDES